MHVFARINDKNPDGGVDVFDVYRLFLDTFVERDVIILSSNGV